MNLIALLENHAGQRPTDSAMRFLDHRGALVGQLNWRDLRDATCATAQRFKALRGERVLLICDPGLSFMPTLLGCMAAGVIVVPLAPIDVKHSHTQRATIARIVVDADIRHGIASGQSFAALRHLDLGLKYHDVSVLETASQPLELPDEDALVGLLYTSGSTAEPKAVPLRHRHLAYNARTCCQAWSISASSRLSSWMPNQHSFGLVYNVLLPLFSGAEVVAMAPSSFVNNPRLWLQSLSDHACTHGAAATFGYQLCVDQIDLESCEGLDLSHWQVGLISAEPVRKGVCDGFMSRFRSLGLRENLFCALYGLSESGPITSQAACTPITYDMRPQVPADLALARLGSSLPETRIVIVDPQKQVEVAHGEVGEVWVQGPSVFDGYWRREQANAQAFASLENHSGTFFRTGDQGFWQDGALVLNGRIKEMMIVRGKNFYPQDIEQIARETHPVFEMGCAAAFAQLSENLGDDAPTLVLEAPRELAEAAALARQVAQHVLAQLGLQLTRVVLVPNGSVQKTASGKIRRMATAQALKSMNPIAVWQQSTDVATQASDGDLLEQLCGLVAAQAALDLDEVEADVPLDEYDLDSLSYVALADAISQRFGKPFTATLFYKYETLAEIAEALER